MKIQNKSIINLGIALFISLVIPGVSYGMETGNKPQESIKELEMYLRLLPKELQQHILSFQDAINFLALQPITLEGHTDHVSSIAIAGDKVVTGSPDKTAKIWDINTGKLLHTLQGHTSGIYFVATN